MVESYTGSSLTVSVGVEIKHGELFRPLSIHNSNLLLALQFMSRYFPKQPFLSEVFCLVGNSGQSIYVASMGITWNKHSEAK